MGEKHLLFKLPGLAKGSNPTPPQFQQFLSKTLCYTHIMLCEEEWVMHGRWTDESAGDCCACGLTCYMCFLQSLDGDALSVIENPAAVEQRFNSGNTAGASGTEGEPGWLKGTQTQNYSKIRQSARTITGRSKWKPLQLLAQWQGIESSHLVSIWYG